MFHALPWVPVGGVCLQPSVISCPSHLPSVDTEGAYTLGSWEMTLKNHLLEGAPSQSIKLSLLQAAVLNASLLHCGPMGLEPVAGVMHTCVQEMLLWKPLETGLWGGQGSALERVSVGHHPTASEGNSSPGDRGLDSGARH